MAKSIAEVFPQRKLEEVVTKGQEKAEKHAGVPRLCLKPEEAAVALGMSEKNLWSQSMPRGDIPCFKLGSRTMYAVHHLKQWMDSIVNSASEYTCSECDSVGECPHAYDDYNTGGDCLADK
jgi:hypothetical protein